MPGTIETKEEILATMSQVDLLAGVPAAIREKWLDGNADETSGKDCCWVKPQSTI